MRKTADKWGMQAKRNVLSSQHLSKRSRKKSLLSAKRQEMNESESEIPIPISTQVASVISQSIQCRMNCFINFTCTLRSRENGRIMVGPLAHGTKVT